MKNNFPFLGVYTDARRKMVRLIARGSISMGTFRTDVRKLWKEPWRECHYAACDILTAPAALKQLDGRDLPWITELVISHSWWDTIDCLAPSVAGSIMKGNSVLTGAMSRMWMHSNNVWLQRSAVIFQCLRQSFSFIRGQVGHCVNMPLLVHMPLKCLSANMHHDFRL